MLRQGLGANRRPDGKHNVPLQINLSLLPGDVVDCYRLVILMSFQFPFKRVYLGASLGHFEVQTCRLAFTLQGEEVAVFVRFVLMGSGLGLVAVHAL